MPKLYLMRHGQTELNAAGAVQGRADAPLTPLGVSQAKGTAAWLAQQNVDFDAMLVSPLGRTRNTADVVRAELEQAHSEFKMPPIEFSFGLIERCYGEFEAGPRSIVPADIWDPGDALIPYGGEGNDALRERMYNALCELMSRPGVENALAVSHGSITLQFKQMWEHLAECDQDVHLNNCCVLVFRFDPHERTFTCEQIVNPND